MTTKRPRSSTSSRWGYSITYVPSRRFRKWKWQITYDDKPYSFYDFMVEVGPMEFSDYGYCRTENSARLKGIEKAKKYRDDEIRIIRDREAKDATFYGRV